MMSPQSLISYACNGAWPNAMLFAADACALYTFDGLVQRSRGDSSQGKGPFPIRQ